MNTIRLARWSNHICSSFVLLIVVAQSYAQWPRFHGNDFNTGVVGSALGRDGNLLQLWSYEYSGYLSLSSPALADLDGDGTLEIVIQGDSPNAVIALNGEDGSVCWTRSLEGQGVGYSSVIGDLLGDQLPEVVVLSGDSIMVLNGAVGELCWKQPSTGDFGMSPCTADLNGDGDQEVAYSSTFETRAYSGETGAVLWIASEYGRAMYGSTVAGDLNLDGKAEVLAIFIDSSSSALCMLDGASGGQVWSHPLADFVSSPASAVADIDMDGKPEVVSCSGNHELQVLNAESGSQLWSVQLSNSEVYSAPCVADVNQDDLLEIIVGLWTDRELRAYSATGNMLWQTNLSPGCPIGTPAIADLNGDLQMEIVQTSYSDGLFAGALQIFSGPDGGLLWGDYFDGGVSASPAIGDVNGDGFNEVVISCQNGSVYAYGTEPQGICLHVLLSLRVSAGAPSICRNLYAGSCRRRLPLLHHHPCWPGQARG